MSKQSYVLWALGGWVAYRLIRASIEKTQDKYIRIEIPPIRLPIPDLDPKLVEDYIRNHISFTPSVNPPGVNIVIQTPVGNYTTFYKVSTSDVLNMLVEKLKGESGSFKVYRDGKDLIIQLPVLFLPKEGV